MRQLILKILKENPVYGKSKIVVILRRDYRVNISESSVGRILKGFMISGKIKRYISSSATRSRGQELFSLGSLERKPHMLLCEPTQLNKVALGTKYKSNTRGRSRERTSLPTAAMLG